jgi:DNA-binding XRE family transcriptional regulator
MFPLAHGRFLHANALAKGLKRKPSRAAKGFNRVFHEGNCIQIGNPLSSAKVSIPDNDLNSTKVYAFGMDRIGPKKAIRWYLKEWRAHLHLTQDQLAERLGTNKGQVSKLETGKQRFNDDWIACCAEALGIEPGDLLRDPKAPDVRTLLLTASPEVRNRALKVLDALLRAG